MEVFGEDSGDIITTTKHNLPKRIVSGIIDVLTFYGLVALIFFLAADHSEPGWIDNLSPISSDGPYITLTFFVSWLTVTIVIEQLLGATMGNLVMGLRALPKDDTQKKLSLKQSVLRHLLDFLEFSFFYGIGSALLIYKTHYNQRLGDVLAGTVVIDLKDPEQGSRVVVDSSKFFVD